VHGGVKEENVVDFSISVNTFIPDFIILEDNLKYEKKYTYVEWIEEDFRKIFGEESIIIAGATEAFHIIGWTIMRDASVIIPQPNYTEYERVATFSSANVRKEWILEEKTLKFEKLLSIIDEEVRKYGKVVLITGNPNNPTGIYEDISKFIETIDYLYDDKVTFVLDEAFIDFVSKEKIVPIDIDKFENVILVRTFTKILGIPGVRIGYVKTKKYKKVFEHYRSPWAIGGMGYGVIDQIIKNYQEYTRFIQDTANYYDEEKVKFSEFIEYPSSTNYFVCHIGDEDKWFELARQNKIHTRKMHDFGMEGYTRIGLKSQQENAILYELLKQHRKEL